MNRKKLKKLRENIKIQRQRWEANHKEYTRGFINALILAESILTNEEPDYIIIEKEEKE